MKSVIIRFGYAALVFILIVSYLFFLVYSLNIGRRLQKNNNYYKWRDYYKISPILYDASKVADDTEARKAAAAGPGKLRSAIAERGDFVYALNQSPLFNALNLNEPRFVFGVWAKDIRGVPTLEQSSYGGGNGRGLYPDGDMNERLYYQRLKDVNEGKKRSFGFYARQVTSDLPEQSTFSYYEGSGYDEGILYSDYIRTGKPLPVVIGYGLRDLFSVGDVCRVDFPDFIPLPEWVKDDNAYYRDYEKYCPDGDMLIEIVGILSEDSHMIAPLTFGFRDDFYPQYAIILPRFDVYNTPRSALSDEIDVNAYKVFTGDATTTFFFTKASPDKAHAEFMRIIEEAGYGDCVFSTSINGAYFINGHSLVDYNRTSLGIFIVCTLLLAAVSVVSVIRTVDRNLKIYTLHYLVGATRKRLFIKTVIDHTVSAFIAAGAVYCFAVLIRTHVEGTIHRVILENSFILTTLLLAAAVYTVFVWTVAFFKIRRTDFSRILKEGL